MKTTIEISDALFADARMLAAAEGATLRQLMEAGLRHAEAQRKLPVASFSLRDASFGGNGLVAELKDAPCKRVRQMAYEGRGG